MSVGRSAPVDESEAGLMFDAIVTALEGRSDLLGWTVRQVNSRGAQLYSVPSGVECIRRTGDERYVVEVLRDTTIQGGEKTVGAGNVTMLPGDDIDAAIDAAVLRAGWCATGPTACPDRRPCPTCPLATSASPATWKPG